MQPDAVDLWQVLLTATEASASAAGDLASLQALMPVLLGDRGEVQGVKGRVAEMISAAPDTKGSSRYCRPEDAGALLFMSSNTAIKATGERVREAKALLEGLIVSFEERDVFINHECAAAQFGRNSGAIRVQLWRNSGAILRHSSEAPPPLQVRQPAPPPRGHAERQRFEGGAAGATAALPQRPADRLAR